jgi:hypothetical protein
MKGLKSARFKVASGCCASMAVAAMTQSGSCSTPRIAGGFHPGIRIHTTGIDALLQVSERAKSLGGLGRQSGEDFVPMAIVGRIADGPGGRGRAADGSFQQVNRFAVEGSTMGGCTLLELRMESRGQVLYMERGHGIGRVPALLGASKLETPHAGGDVVSSRPVLWMIRIR